MRLRSGVLEDEAIEGATIREQISLRSGLPPYTSVNRKLSLPGGECHLAGNTHCSSTLQLIQFFVNNDDGRSGAKENANLAVFGATSGAAALTRNLNRTMTLLLQGPVSPRTRTSDGAPIHSVT
jgi:hypothetical protein